MTTQQKAIQFLSNTNGRKRIIRNCKCYYWWIDYKGLAAHTGITVGGTRSIIKQLYVKNILDLWYPTQNQAYYRFKDNPL